MKSIQTTADIRNAFLSFFESHHHTPMPSGSLVPKDDPSLLFTNAGMVPFKQRFLGQAEQTILRACSSQKCMRAGGKHNDLDNVGYTARHHTFFEMLGNFSFGDYFKQEAIAMAWHFLTEVLNLPKSKLWVTVHHNDQEAAAIWINQIGVDPSRLSYCGDEDNFWSMGDTGPCGPCSEIFYDHGPSVPGGPPGSPDADGDRYIEIWNLVFMQFNRSEDGQMSPLPSPCVDTGMGLERIAAVLQGVHNNYDIDLFQVLLKALSNILDCQDTTQSSMRVIADHIRAISFLVCDGVLPSNEGRGYVLRRIIRRALRHGLKLGCKTPFLSRMVPALVEAMGAAYPELEHQSSFIQQVILAEETQFSVTLEKGMKMLDQVIDSLNDTVIPGDVLFQLYDTYGFPPDLTADVAREQGLTVDMAQYELAMQQQRKTSQGQSQFTANTSVLSAVKGETVFIGYEQLYGPATVQQLLTDEGQTQSISIGQTAYVVLDVTPFYAESGGQVGDRGIIDAGDGQFEVMDTVKHGTTIVHHGMLLSGSMSVGDAVEARVGADRQAITLNHSATHMLHEALRQVLGEHVQQKGSLVEAARLRFDFTHPQSLTASELSAVEDMVNQHIRKNIVLEKKEMALDAAKASGAMALFGEKYGDRVRVVSMPHFSTEICGGTHVRATGDIGFFKIISESAVAAGIRRIEAVTGQVAADWVRSLEQTSQQLSDTLKVPADEALTKVMQLLAQNKTLSKSLASAHQKLAAQASHDLIDQGKVLGDVRVFALQLEQHDRQALRQTYDLLKSKMTDFAVVLSSIENNKVIVLAGVSSSCLSFFSAPELLRVVTAPLNGKGGGRPDLAQGGGDNPEKLPAALETVYEWVASKLAKDQ